jgi:hypothetical protein
LKDIYIWANKILLGILYAEWLPPLNRRYPRGRPILPHNWRDAFNMTHFLIQSLRFPIKFIAEGEERIPVSVFLFDLKSPKDPKQADALRQEAFGEPQRSVRLLPHA